MTRDSALRDHSVMSVIHRAHSEAECSRIARALVSVPKGSLILDLPCGTGRLTTSLVRLGYKVVSADHSQQLVDQARQGCGEELGLSEEQLDEVVRFGEQDIRKTTFEDGAFDAVVCNGLLHQYAEADARRALLSELSRISKGPIVVSFRCSLSLETLRARVVNMMRSVTPERIPLPFSVFCKDLAAAGLRAAEVHPVRLLISEQTIVKAVRVA